MSWGVFLYARAVLGPRVIKMNEIFLLQDAEYSWEDINEQITAMSSAGGRIVMGTTPGIC